MNLNYEENAKIFKAMSDPSRLKIIDILSCGEICACDILEHFDFTQPTLSHHMKVLMDCGIVRFRKEGQWTYYFINHDNCNKVVIFLMNLITDTDECVCNHKSKCNCK
jgi:ArsR family transcriptional regulator